jgi:hypothetical protein
MSCIDGWFNYLLIRTTRLTWQDSVPRYTTATLMEWFQSEVPARTAHIFQYFQERTAMVLDILDESETITKTSYALCVFIHLAVLTTAPGSLLEFLA